MLQTHHYIKCALKRFDINLIAAASKKTTTTAHISLRSCSMVTKNENLLNLTRCGFDCIFKLDLDFTFFTDVFLCGDFGGLG
jgi:hypothetical protein